MSTPVIISIIIYLAVCVGVAFGVKALTVMWRKKHREGKREKHPLP